MAAGLLCLCTKGAPFWNNRTKGDHSKVAQPQNFLIFFDSFWALGASDSDGGPPEDSHGGRMAFWDALELELWPKKHFDTFSEKFFQGFFYITRLFGAPQALGTSPSDSS